MGPYVNFSILGAVLWANFDVESCLENPLEPRTAVGPPPPESPSRHGGACFPRAHEPERCQDRLLLLVLGLRVGSEKVGTWIQDGIFICVCIQMCIYIYIH